MVQTDKIRHHMCTPHTWTNPTCVTFSVTLCVRSMSLQGAMMSISPAGRAMSGSGLKSTKFRVIWGIFEMVRYRIRSESDVEFRMFDLLFTAPADTQKVRGDVRGQTGQTFVFTPLLFLTSAAAGRPDAGPPILPVPLGPHGLDLIHRRGATHAVEAFPRAAVCQGAVGARALWFEAQAMMGHHAGWGLAQGSSGYRTGYGRVRAE